MAGYKEEEGIEAARILLSLRDRKLQRWPDWVPRSSSAAELWRRSEEPVVEEEDEEDEEEELPVPGSKRLRAPRRRRPRWSLLMENVDALMRYCGSAGSGASPGREDGARSQPRGREKPKVKVKLIVAGRPDTPPCYVAPAGSGPSTSGAGRARSPTEKAQVKVAARKETMAASSPETPLDYAAAAGSGASSSGDDGTRSSPAKRKAPGASGSVGASSGDEGCSSPAKRPRADLNSSATNMEEPKPEKEKTEEENYRDEKGHLLFDLNEEITPWQD